MSAPVKQHDVSIWRDMTPVRDMVLLSKMLALDAGQSQKLVQYSDEPAKITWVIRTSSLQTLNKKQQRSLETDATTLIVPTASGEKEKVLVRMKAYVSKNGALRWSVCLPKNSFGCLARWVGPQNLKLRISHSTWTEADQFRGEHKLWTVADHTEEDQIELNMRIRLYTPPRGLPECPGRFILKRMLGKGGFGEVWEVEDTETGSTDFLAKLSSKPGSHDISVEAQALRMLAESSEGGRKPGFPQVMGAYKHDDGRDMMIIQRLQRNLQNILLDKELVTGRKFSPETVIEVGLQLIDRIEHMHWMGFVHRDIKDENIMISEENKDIIYLIDMGLAKGWGVKGVYEDFQKVLHIAQYMNEDEDIRGLSGTELLASRDAHVGPVSRRGDIENLVFVLMKMAAGRLPWSDVREVGSAGQDAMFRRKGDIEEIRSFMQTKCATAESPRLGTALVARLGTALVEMLEHSRQLAFDQTPDYVLLSGLLIQCHTLCFPPQAPPPTGVDRDGTNESNVSRASGKLCWNQAAEEQDRLTELPNLAPTSEFSLRSASPVPLESAGTTASPNTLATGSGPSSRRYDDTWLLRSHAEHFHAEHLNATTAAHNSVAGASRECYQGPYFPTGMRDWQGPHGAAVRAAQTCPKNHDLNKIRVLSSGCWCRECQLPIPTGSDVYKCTRCLEPKAQYNLCQTCAAMAWGPSLDRGLVEKTVELMGFEETEKWASPALPDLLELPEHVKVDTEWSKVAKVRMPRSAVHMVMMRLKAKSAGKSATTTAAVAPREGYSSSSMNNNNITMPLAEPK